MMTLAWLVPALPLSSALALLVFGRSLGQRSVALLGVLWIGISAVLALALLTTFIVDPPAAGAFTHSLWPWMSVNGFQPEVALRLDALSLTMAAVVSGVGFLIHLYSVAFMAGEPGYARFFGSMNLFVGAMLILVLADNLLLLFLGWEGVGLCSYLLIGFWYQDRGNEQAARKAFIVTRIGDTAMAIGLLLLFNELHTLRIQELVLRARDQWTPGTATPAAAALLILGGAVGKSAQLPLQTWLPDAMAGPTPTSALIHAATMVTAGVYLIARLHGLFELAPQVLLIVAIVGAATLLLAGTSALFQTDIKRALAYSTMSQIGYMFLALGVGAWSAAIFHLVTHAFFKALLFLAAGVVIQSTPHHEHDIFKMGGLRRSLPLAFWSFVIGGGALAGLPLVTAGFFSKDKIIWQTWASVSGGPWLACAGMVGALITALYVSRLIGLVFFGPATAPAARRAPRSMRLPLYVLAFFAITAGYLDVLHARGLPTFSVFVQRTLPSPILRTVVGSEFSSGLITDFMVAVGIIAAVPLVRRQRVRAQLPPGQGWLVDVARFGRAGWGFDEFYRRIFVVPVAWFGRAGRWDVVDSIYEAVGEVARDLHRLLSASETGRVRTYAAGLALGALILLAIVLAS
jgi:NADH-quinone oxidoreductase subunit L